MKKNGFTFIMPVLALALLLASVLAACDTNVPDELSSAADSDIGSEVYSDGCSADVSEEKLSYREQCEKDWEEMRKDPRPFDINDITTWYAEAKDGGLSAEAAALAKAGMTLEEAVAVLGEPQRDVGSGLIILEWDMKTGEVLQMGFTQYKYDIPLGPSGLLSSAPRIYLPDKKDKNKK